MSARMNLRRLVVLPVAVTTAIACSSAPSGGRLPADAGADVDAGGEFDSGIATDATDAALTPDAGRDDIDDDFPLALASGLAPTPPMGWNSWNALGCSGVSEAAVEQVADAMMTNGMRQAGYQVVTIDDCWAIARGADGTEQSDSTTFPDGIKAVADHVHADGLKLGIYSDRGTATCQGRPGSQGYETLDATTYAAWGADYLKYDNCNAPLDIQTQYQTMADALTATGRPIVYSMSAWAFYEWAVGVGNLWRTTSDIVDNWTSVFANIMDNRAFAAYAGPNHWNDPDMLEVGNAGLTVREAQSHFSLWAIVDSPLIAGNDPRTMPASIKNILTNPEVIALNQDPLALQGVPVSADGQSVWAKPLNESGVRGVVLLNAGTAAADVTFTLPEIGLRAGSAAARDLVQHVDLPVFQDSFTASGVPPHGSVALRVKGTEPLRPAGTAYLSDLVPIYAANGLGLFDKDKSANATALSIGGTSFAKGLGVVAPSQIIYRLAKKCTSFTATVGLDDSTHGQGSVVFQVWADGGDADAGSFSFTKLFDSQKMTGGMQPVSVQVPLDNKRRLKLLVTNALDGSAQDRADWANAQVTCAP